MTQRLELCPKCSATRSKNSKQKCLSINIETGLYKCHHPHCNYRGKLKDDGALPYVKPKPKIELPKTDMPEWAINIFKHRGISIEVLKRNRIACNNKEIIFPYFRDGKVVNVKYRSRDKKYRQVAGGEKIFYGLDDIKETKEAIIVEGECFPGDAEILTPTGWTKFEDYRDSKVLQVDNDFKGQFVRPLHKIKKKYNGDLLRVDRGGNYTTLTTPKHELVHIHKSGKILKTPVKDMPKTILGKIPTVAFIEGKGIGLSKDQISLCLAISADASIRINGYKSRYAVFGLKKIRKISRLRNLLSKLNIKASDNLLLSRGQVSICYHIPDYVPGRILPWEWITNATREERLFILQEMVHWDGNHVPNRIQTEYSSNKIENATWMQTMAHTCGIMSTVMDRSNRYGSWYKVSILHNKDSVSWQGIVPETVPYNGKVYCVTVPTGMILVRQNRRISVSGNCDKLALEEAGFLNVLSVPDGAPSIEAKNYESKFSYLQNCEKELEHIERFIIAVDNDPVGEKLQQELIRRLGVEKCFIVTWPEGCKDANDTLKKSLFGVVESLENAKPVPVSGVFDYDSIEKAHDRLYHNNGREKGKSTGWFGVDRFYTIRPGEITVVTGQPSLGKSEVIDAIMVNLAMNEDWRFATFSPENHPIELHVSKIQMKYVGKPFSRNFEGHMTENEHENSKAWLREHFWYIAPEDHELNIDHIIKKAEVCVLRHGIKGLSIDPWNEIDHSRPAGQTETEYISSALTKIRRFARTHGVHVWVIAHPTKLQKDDKGKYPVATPYQISGSAHFYNKADNCLSIWRDLHDESKEVEFHVQKIRFREIGKVGKAYLIYQLGSSRYKDGKNTC